MLPLAASIAIAVALGVIISGGTVSSARRSSHEAMLLASLGTAFGLGLVSCTFFAWLLLWGPTAPGLPAAEAAFVAVVAALVISTRRRGAAGGTLADASADPRTPSVLTWGFGAALASAVAAFAGISLRHPHGSWDAWMTWNVHARFIFRGGDGWLAMFSEASRLRHADYPFLVPSLVARSWSYAGLETQAAPAVLAFLFTFATVGVVVGTLARLRTLSQGLLAGLVLVSTPFFVAHGASQYADVPVGLYFAICLALLLLHDDRDRGSSAHLLLAGLAAGLAAWTKNEGLLFLLVLFAARWLALRGRLDRRGRARELGLLGTGALPVLVLVLYFKLALAPENDVVSSSSQGLGSTLARLLEPDRYLFVAKNFVGMALDFGRNDLVSVGWLLLTYLLCVGMRREVTRSGGVRTGVFTLGLMLIGHGLVYLTAPADMERLLDASIERVFLQLWPGALLLYFVIARAPEETIRALRPVRSRRLAEPTREGAIPIGVTFGTAPAGSELDVAASPSRLWEAGAATPLRRPKPFAPEPR